MSDSTYVCHGCEQAFFAHCFPPMLQDVLGDYCWGEMHSPRTADSPIGYHVGPGGRPTDSPFARASYCPACWEKREGFPNRKCDDCGTGGRWLSNKGAHEQGSHILCLSCINVRNGWS